MSDKQLTTDELFGLLCKAMQADHLKGKIPQEAHNHLKSEWSMRITNHIRSKTNHNTIISYHNNGASTEDKEALYKECLQALMTKDFSALEGQVAQAQSAPTEVVHEPVEETPKKAKRSLPAPPPRNTTPVEPEPPVNQDAQNALEVVAKHLGVQLHKPAAIDEKKLVDIALGAVDTKLGEMKDEVVADVMTMAESSMTNYIKSIKLPPRDVVEIVQGGEVKEIKGRQHYRFPLLLKAIAAGVNVLMVGPAGSFKTTAAQKAAEALGAEYEALSFGPQTSKADLVGYKDANGTYHDTGFVRRVTQGGVFCGDELDAAHAGVLTIINMPLSNGHVSTPRGFDTKHKDFRFVGCCNTYGTGANRQYVGRNQLDAATLDRFFIIDWPVDDGLEAHLAGVEEQSTPFDVRSGGIPSPAAWLEKVRKVREAINKLAIRHIVSPRATISGIKLAEAGVGLDHLEAGLIWRGLEQASVDKIKANL